MNPPITANALGGSLHAPGPTRKMDAGARETVSTVIQSAGFCGGKQANSWHKTDV